MTINELAQNLIDNDRSGDYRDRKVTLEEAKNFIDWMDPDADRPEDLTPETLADALNEIITADAKRTYVAHCIQNHEDFPEVGAIDLDSARFKLENAVLSEVLNPFSPEEFVSLWNELINDPAVLECWY